MRMVDNMRMGGVKDAHGLGSSWAHTCREIVLVPQTSIVATLYTHYHEAGRCVPASLEGALF